MKVKMIIPRPEVKSRGKTPPPPQIHTDRKKTYNRRKSKAEALDAYEI